MKQIKALLNRSNSDNPHAQAEPAATPSSAAPEVCSTASPAVAADDENPAQGYDIHEKGYL